MANFQMETLLDKVYLKKFCKKLVKKITFISFSNTIILYNKYITKEY